MFTRKIFLLLVSCLFLLPSWCLADQALHKPAAFLPESRFEFSPLVEGVQVVHDFIIHNRGNAPLEILKIRSG